MRATSPQETEMDRLLAEQRQLWLRGERPSAEQYVAKYPLLLAGPEELLDLVYHEYLLREELQDVPDLSDYQRRFPVVADVLCRQVCSIAL